MDQYMSKFYVYELWNPIKNQPFYVGKGHTKNTNKYYRLSVHLRQINYDKINNRHKANVISQILDSGFEIGHKVILETESEKLAMEKEKELIKFYGRRDKGTGILTNMTDGGEGLSGYKHTESHREKLRHNNPGAKVLSKEIYAINPCGTIFNRYDSICQAAKIHKSTSTNICKAAIENKNWKVKGYFWRFVQNFDKMEDFLSIKRKTYTKTQMSN
jgi:hypothetical protein